MSLSATDLDKLKKEVLGMVKKDKADADNPFLGRDVSVQHKGSKIILPDDPRPMSYDEGIIALQMRKKEEETVVSVNEIIKAFPFDGAYAFMNAMKTRYGWATPIPTPSFFGPKPPQTISLEIGVNQTTQIIWGDFVIPAIDGKLTTGVMHDDSGMVYFCIKGQVKKSQMAEVKILADLTRALVKELSIYKGKAIRLEVDEDGDVDWNKAPKFVDLSKVNADELTYSEEVMAQIKMNLFTPIEHTEACRRHNIPLKRGVLLQGQYGTGKTLAAFVTAQKCEENGWTFVLLSRVSGLGDALQFARMYSPAVVFAEDIDREVSGDERTVEIDDVLNTIDGIESKGSDIITILTSNHIENINQAMLRPGRLDAIIHVSPPDAKASEKLVRIYARTTLATDADLTAVGEVLNGKIPAVIREIVERSKLYAISRNPEVEDVKIQPEDLVFSAKGMEAHLELLAPKDQTVSKEKQLYDLFAGMVTTGVQPINDNVDTANSDLTAIKKGLGIA